MEKNQTYPDELSTLVKHCNSTFLGHTVICFKSVGTVCDTMDCDAVLCNSLLGIQALGMDGVFIFSILGVQESIQSYYCTFTYY